MAMTVFHENKKPIALRSEAFRIVSGQPAETVPAGQIHEQKIGEPMPSLKKRRSGATMHKRMRHIYFAREAPREILRSVRVFGTFFVGILYRSSWMKPIGQRNAQTARPSNVPVSKRNPVTKKGNLPFAMEF
jgi:hypothetical protein